MKSTLSIMGLVSAIFFAAMQAEAHHSFAAVFTDEIITVEGTVERMSFSNPHVQIFFHVTDENGQVTQWRSEGGAATGKRRQGWDANSVVEGDYVRITGRSTRNGSSMVSMGDIYFVDPQSGEVIGSPDVGDANPEVTASIPMEFQDGRPNLTGSWTRGGGMGGRRNRPPAPFNDAGAALQDAYDPVNDPQVQCEMPGVVRQAAFTPHPARLQQFDDHIVLSYEEYGGVRTIYFDDRDLVGGEHSNFGQSIARYEGQKLIVETTHLLGNLSGANGNAITGQTTTVETYYRNEDVDGASALVLEMVITDPGHLTGPWTMGWVKAYTPEYEFIEVDCYKPLAY